MTNDDASPMSAAKLDTVSLALRLGLGPVFVIGGWSKLSQLIDPAREAGILSRYMGADGYINTFFAEYLFSGAFPDWVTPWSFLTALSSFELVSGLCLIAGLAVRPLALVYGFLLWTFVIALPVTTSPGVDPTVSTYTSLALLVQIRDIGLSGMMFALFNLGSGATSLDRYLLGMAFQPTPPDWRDMGLLLRLSVAAVMIVGGAFAGFDHIQSFAAAPWLLLALGLTLAGGFGTRIAGIAVMGVMLWYMATKLSLDKSLITNLNGVKREIAFLVAAGVLAFLGGGVRFSVARFVTRVVELTARHLPRGATVLR